VNRAELGAAFMRLDRENRDAVWLFHQGSITGEECRIRCEAIRAEIERLRALPFDEELAPDRGKE